jgi:hypothetical protein
VQHLVIRRPPTARLRATSYGSDKELRTFIIDILLCQLPAKYAIINLDKVVFREITHLLLIVDPELTFAFLKWEAKVVPVYTKKIMGTT